MQGWIKLHRKIRECDMWNSKEPFDRRSAWIDLLLMANHEERKVMFGNAIILVPAGSFITSETKLSQRWRWSRHRVDDYLKLLVFDAKIGLKKDRQKTTISIENWAKYQTDDTSEGQQKDSERTSKGHQKDTNKNDKNYKNTNVPPIIPPKRFAPPTTDEVRAYCSERGNRVDAQTFVDFYASKGWKVGNQPMKDWQAAVRTWEKREGKQGGKPAKRTSAHNHTTRQYTPDEIGRMGRDLLEEV